MKIAFSAWSQIVLLSLVTLTSACVVESEPEADDVSSDNSSALTTGTASESEPNNTRSSADTVNKSTVTGQVHGTNSARDVDWFAFAQPSDTNVQFSLRGSHVAFDVYADAYPGPGTQTLATNRTFYTLLNPPSSRRLYVAVKSTDASSHSYQLSTAIEVNGSCTGCPSGTSFGNQL